MTVDRALLEALTRNLFPIVPDSDLQLAAAERELTPAAVLVLLFPRHDDIRFILTERPPSMPNHGGQISLPGGRVETTDAGYWETSLRETGEELGVRTGRIRPLGRLPHTPVFVSRYVIHPFVGWLPYAPRIRADPREVARVLEVSVASLGDANAVYEEEWEIRGSRRLVSFYRFDEMVVWGATARILSELAARLFGGRPGQMSPGAVLPAREVSG